MSGFPQQGFGCSIQPKHPVVQFVQDRSRQFVPFLLAFSRRKILDLFFNMEERIIIADTALCCGILPVIFRKNFQCFLKFAPCMGEVFLLT